VTKQKDFVKLYYGTYLPIYSDLVAFLADKPVQVLIEFENVAAHLIVYLENQNSVLGKGNLQRANNHLTRLCIDMSKMLWVEIKKQVEKLFKNKLILQFASNKSISELLKLKFEFFEKAKIARRQEMINVGKDSISCVRNYREAIEAGFNILNSFDQEKINSLRKYKILYYMKINIVGFIIGFVSGVLTSMLGTHLYNKLFPSSPISK
jgi:hypothetical protein